MQQRVIGEGPAGFEPHLLDWFSNDVGAAPCETVRFAYIAKIDGARLRKPWSELVGDIGKTLVKRRQ